MHVLKINMQLTSGTRNYIMNFQNSHKKNPTFFFSFTQGTITDGLLRSLNPVLKERYVRPRGGLLF